MLLSAPAAKALYSDKLFLSANASVNYDSNVLRFADGFPSPGSFRGLSRGDIFYGYGLGLRLDVPVSRQRFRADIGFTEYRYDTYSLLDYTGFNGRGTWDWRVGTDWYGQVTLGARQARQTISTQIGFFIPLLYRAYDENVTVRYALTPRWELQGGVAGYQVRYNEDVARGGDFDSRTVDAGAAYKAPSGNSTGFRLRWEYGEWINRVPAQSPTFGTSYDQYTASAVVDWGASGHLRLYGDLGYTVRQRDFGTAGDFNGVSGNLLVDWRATGKLFVRTRVYQTRGPFESPIANYTRQTGVDLLPSYQLTGKMVLQGTFTYRVVDYLGLSQPGFAPPGGGTRQDKLTTLGIGLNYRASRTATLSASVSEQARDSNVPFANFKATLVFLQGQIEF
jgi:exopolysaccharide biosynthesis operon protein EpsL